MLETLTNGRDHRPHAGLLPHDVPNRDDFVGISIIKNGTYFGLRLSISKSLCNSIGQPERVSITGTPENGYLIAAAKAGPKPIEAGSNRFYIQITADKANAPRDKRQTVWLRSEIDKKRLRIPPLPPAWINGDPEFRPGALCEEGPRDMQLGKTAGDDAVRSVPAPAVPIAPTVPPPKPVPDYKLPENVGIADAQALLGRKLDEARAVMRELESRTGLRFTLTRNFQITLDLTGR